MEEVATWDPEGGLVTSWWKLFLNERPNLNNRILNIVTMEVGDISKSYTICTQQVHATFCLGTDFLPHLNTESNNLSEILIKKQQMTVTISSN